MGAVHLFARLVDQSPEAFQRFAEDHVYALRPLTQAVVNALNADLAVEDLADDLAAARYPSVNG
jgi:hypothetical protein